MNNRKYIGMDVHQASISIAVSDAARVREVLDLTRLSAVIPLAADTASGLAALRGEDPAARTVSR